MATKKALLGTQGLDANNQPIINATTITASGIVTAGTFSGSGASLSSIPNSALSNSSISINSTAVSLGGSISISAVDSTKLPLAGGTLTGALSGTSASFSSSVTASSLVKSGGTSSQFLKADGSVDTNSYYLASNPNGYITSSSSITGNANNITQYTINQNLGTTSTPTFSGLTVSGNATASGLDITGSASPLIRIIENTTTGNPKLQLLDYTNITTPSEGTELWYESSTGHSYLSSIYSGGSLIFRTANTEKVRITSSGLVGIGTSSPQSKFHIGGDGAQTITTPYDIAFNHYYSSWGANATRTWLKKSWNATYNDFTYLGVTGNATNTVFGALILSNAVPFAVGLGVEGGGVLSTEYLRVSTAGNLGVGNSSPAFKLDVNGTGNFNGVLSIASGTATSGANQGLAIYHGSDASAYGRIRFYQNNTNNATIHNFSSAWQNGSSSTINTTSTGCINIDGPYGVTIGGWNGPTASFNRVSGLSTFNGPVTVTGALGVSGAITQAGNQVLHAGNYSSYALPNNGSWLGDLGSYGYARQYGFEMTGGSAVSFLYKSGQASILVDGNFIAFEGGGFYSSSNSSGGTMIGMRALATTTLEFNARASYRRSIQSSGGDDFYIELTAPNPGNTGGDIGLRFHSEAQWWRQIRANVGGFRFTQGSDNSTVPITASNITAEGIFGAYRNDVQRVFESFNTSAGSPSQFFIDHSYGNVNIGNSRGALLIQGSVALNAGNYSSYAFPLTGGGLNGDLNLGANYLRFDQSGTRSWNMRATGGNLDIASGDGSGDLRYQGQRIPKTFVQSGEPSGTITNGDVWLQY